MHWSNDGDAVCPWWAAVGTGCADIVCSYVPANCRCGIIPRKRFLQLTVESSEVLPIGPGGTSAVNANGPVPV